MNHCGTRKIETKRLLLRQFTRSDAADLLDLWIADPNVQSEYGEPTYETMDAVEELLKKWIAGYENPAFYRWAMVAGYMRTAALPRSSTVSAPVFGARAMQVRHCKP